MVITFLGMTRGQGIIRVIAVLVVVLFLVEFVVHVETFF